jgi:archaemetzincin
VGRTPRIVGLVILAVSLCGFIRPGEAQTRTVVIRPLGTVRAELVAAVRDAVAEFWGVEVRVLPAVALPAVAWYEPRQRYRADLLLEFLHTLDDGGAERVLGITAADISITKGAYPDWGIFGYGELGGTVCVVSSHRLGRGGVSRATLLQRLVKVADHELGHTCGLPHCTTPRCLMGDCTGAIATVDAEPGYLCAACRERVRAAGLRGGDRPLAP